MPRPPMTGVTSQPATPTGSQLRRRYMPNTGTSMGGAYGPAASGPKPSSSLTSTGTFGAPTASTTPSYDFGGKGGGAYFPDGGSSGKPMPSMPPMTPNMPQRNGQRPGGGPMFGGFNPAQIQQRNGQWGGVGPGGNFQALGGNALQRWLASQQAQQPPTPAAPPGYVNASTWDQWTSSGINDWFRNSQPQGANDYNAFNQWFQQFGRGADPTAWDRLYGNNNSGDVWTG